MISRLKKLFDGMSSAPEDKTLAADELHLASACLLVEAATMDGDFDDDERTVILNALEEKFGLSGEEGSELIGYAEEQVEQSHQLYGFTRVIKDKMPFEERGKIIEMLWEVAYADGEVHDYEAALVRRVAGLIAVPDKESGLARRRVREKLEQN